MNVTTQVFRPRLGVQAEIGRLKGFRLKGSELRTQTFGLNPFSLSTWIVTEY